MRNVKLKIGNWIISSWDDRTDHFMYHYCGVGSPHTVNPHTVVFTKNIRPQPTHPARWRCFLCDKQPPEGLVGAYLMLESEYAYSVINRVLGLTND